VINLVYADPAQASDIALASRDLAGVHFTGSTPVFNDILRRVGAGAYRNYPRVVGEPAARISSSRTPARTWRPWRRRSCGAPSSIRVRNVRPASRIFVPKSLWPTLRERLVEDIASIRMGDVSDFTPSWGR